MSDMLEQAIIDASALKEAAVKNAETLVLEKYSNQIKNAVESLLEQEDPLAALAAIPTGGAPDTAMDPAAMGGDPMAMDPAAMGEDPAAAAAPYEESSVIQHIPMAATTKTDEPIEIPLDKLMEEIRAVKQQILLDEDMISESIDTDDTDEELDEEILNELEEELALEEKYGAQEELEEEIELNEENLSDIVEQLTVDLHPRNRAMSGWAGAPESRLELAEEELLALEQDSEVRERRAAMRKAVKSLEKINESVVRQNNKLQRSIKDSTKQIEKVTKVSLILKEKLDKSNLLNAKLLYQNKALTSDSLNERQKFKLAEAVSNADSIEEARVIYETLHSTVGSTSRKNSQPKSLSEVVQKTSSIILSSRNNESTGRQTKDPTYNRWKFLAGIDKN